MRRHEARGDLGALMGEKGHLVKDEHTLLPVTQDHQPTAHQMALGGPVDAEAAAAMQRAQGRLFSNAERAKIGTRRGARPHPLWAFAFRR